VKSIAGNPKKCGVETAAPLTLIVAAIPVPGEKSNHQTDVDPAS
jgi:hypothetical protein